MSSTIKKVHIVAFDLPFPPNYGGSTDMYYKYKALKELNIEVVLHVFLYGGKKPADARVTLFPNYNRYSTPESEKAVIAYQKLAQKHGMSLAELSLAFVNQLPFVTSNIIGATKMSQLKENINSIHIELSEEILAEINEIHKVIPNPAP